MTQQPIPEKPRHLFNLQPPLGYETVRKCSVGHPVVFQHKDTGGQFVPLTLNNQIACPICIAYVTGMQCTRPHMAFEVSDANKD